MFKTVIVQRIIVSNRCLSKDVPNKFHLHNLVINKSKCLEVVICFVNSLTERVRSKQASFVINWWSWYKINFYKRNKLQVVSFGLKVIKFSTVE